MTTPDSWRSSGDWLLINGQRLFVKTLGKGQPILTLHAFPTSSYDYSRIAPLLEQHYQLILFDYPGFGFSEKPRPYPYSLFRYAEAAESIAAHFGIKRTFVLAHDIGDSVALILLARKRLIIERLVLMNGSVLSIPFDEMTMRVMQRALLHPILGPLIGRLGLINKRFFAKTTEKLFSYPLPQVELDDFWKVITYHNGAPLYPTLMGYMLERWQHQHEWLRTLDEHEAPLTLIWGQVDPIATPAVADAVMEYRADATYHRLDSVGHYPHWEAPDVVAGLVRKAFS